MSEEEDSTEKPFEATPRKLEEARKRGEVPISQDLLTAAVYLSMLLAAGMFGLWSVTRTGDVLSHLLSHADRHAEDALSGGTFLTNLIAAIVGATALWFVLPVLFCVLAAMAQQAFVIAPKKMAPKLSRISPLSNAKQKFGRDGLFNFAKSAVKLFVYAAVLAFVAMEWAGEILTSPVLPVSAAMSLGVTVVQAFLVAALIVIVAIGGVDFAWQRAEHLRKQRMSLKELRDELKDSEGDPNTKQARRQKGYDIATNRMVADVPEADVVIVNPTHYAVALKWSRASGTAPICVAKGVDEVAARIREVAKASDVPIHSDPATARALHATVDIGDEIEPDQYRAVAIAIRFADDIRKRAGRRPS